MEGEGLTLVDASHLCWSEAEMSSGLMNFMPPFSMKMPERRRLPGAVAVVCAVGGGGRAAAEPGGSDGGAYNADLPCGESLLEKSHSSQGSRQ